MNSDLPESEGMEEDDENSEVTVFKYRQTLNKSFLNVFPEFNDGDLIPNTVPPNFSKFIQCFRYCLEVFPQMFVPQSSSMVCDNVASAFTEWLMMKLLKCLSQPYSTEVHEGCENLFVSLFQVIQTSDPTLFRCYSLCLLGLMSDLLAYRQSFKPGCEAFLIQRRFALQKNDLLKVENLDLSDCSISVSTKSKCDFLQVRIIHLIRKLGSDLFLFLREQECNIWKMLCHHLENGGFELKMASMDAITIFAEKNGLPNSGYHTNYVLDCLQALLDFCSSSRIEICKDVTAFENAIAACLTNVAERIPKAVHDGVIHEFMLSVIVESIMQTMATSGIKTIRTDVLKSAVTKTITIFITSLEEVKLAIPQQILCQFRTSMCNFFNDIGSYKFLVPIFVYLISYEIRQNIAPGSPVHKTITNDSGDTQASRIPDDKSLPVFMRMNRLSLSWVGVLERMLYLQKSNHFLSNEMAESNLNAISSCLNILLQSSLEFTAKSVPQCYISYSFISPTTEDSHLYLPLDIVSALFRYVLKKCTVTNLGNASFFKEVLGICFSLLCFQDVLPLRAVDKDVLNGIFCLPWLKEKLPIKIPLSISSDEFIDVPSCVKAIALQGLSLMPKSSVKLSNLFLVCAGEDEEMRIATVNVLPMSYFLKIISDDEIHLILKTVMKDSTIDVLVAVSKIIGKLNCIVHSQCITCRLKDASGLFQTIPSVTCNICDSESNASISNLGQNTWVTVLLSDLLQHSDQIVRKECILSIKSFAQHGNLDINTLSCIMEMMGDDDQDVRNNISCIARYIIQSVKRNGFSNLEMEEVLLSKLNIIICMAKSKHSPLLWDTILLTITEFGKVSTHDIHLICLISLLECVLSSLPSVAASARLKIKEIAAFKQCKMQDLFKVYIEPICKFLTQSMLSCDLEDVTNALNILEKISSIFDCNDLRTFLSVTQRYIFPYLVRKDGESTSALIRVFSKLLKTTKRDILLNNFAFIFSHLVCHCNESELERALLYVEKETELEFGTLLRCNYQHIHNELLLHISTHYNKVFAGLETLSVKSEHRAKEKSHRSKEENMADYLQPKLLGFLVFFDSHLLKKSITLDDKKMALESLIVIMQLMGQRHITAVRFKLMTTLRITLRFKDEHFPKICCRAWKTFVHNLEMSALGPMLNQVVVALLPLLEVEFENVLEIFNFLIVENHDSLKDYFHELYFIPDMPQLQDIHIALKDYTENPSSRSDFQTVLYHSLKGVSHENLEVRLHAFAKLKQVLSSNQIPLQEHLLGRESVDHLLSHLISVVIPGCRESDMRARVMLGECLGALGAIDPGRLEMKYVTSKNSDAFLGSVDSENFAFTLIQELARSFLAAEDCRVQDCSAFAIQEVLNIYNLSGRDASTSSNQNSRFWKRFTPDVQEILQVLSNSQYKRLEKIKQSYPRPIYKSSIGKTFSSWVTNWFMHVLLKVKHEKASKLFHSCSMIIKYDLNCLLFLLPHVIVYALINTSETEKQEIADEILAVLSDSDEESLPSDLCHLSSQSIFSVFDHLIKWTNWKENQMNAQASTRASNTKAAEDPHLTSVKNFISEIPKILLAKSSFYCHAYTRALMYLEMHLKDKSSYLGNNISFLQKIYAALDEPDGVAGVAAMRTEKLNLKDAILEHEAIGDMQAAFASYEKAISIYPEEVSYYGGLLKCFVQMDQPSTALTHANGILNNRPEWEEELNCYRIEAAWKLADWDSLQLFLKNETSDKWNVGVGKILMRLNNKDFLGFQEEIKNVRQSQMAPLSAASMEKGAYVRGYEHLSRLHILRDLEQSSKLLQENDQGWSISTFENVLSEWKLRCRLVQSSLRYQKPILDMHRVLLKMFKSNHPDSSFIFDSEISACWLESAKLARKNGHYQRAYSCILEASTIDSPELFLEKTKWHWNKGDKEQAISCLKKGIMEHFPDELKKESKTQLAKAKLLLAVYSEESSITDSKRLIQMYQEIVAAQPHWEESHYHLAKYYDKVVSAVNNFEDNMDKLVSVAKSFGTSLHYGCKHVYHSLPRLLDIWFDMGTRVAEQGKSKKITTVKNMEGALSQMTNIVIPDLWDKLPLYVFMTAFPQLISRICHSDPGIFFQLQAIIVKLLLTYSQQSIWMMLAVSKSSYPMRVQRCKKIFQAAFSQRPDIAKFIQDATKLADMMIELSNKNVTELNTFSISQHFPNLLKLVEDRNFSPIMLPVQSQMIVTLPSKHVSSNNHNPFPFQPICIQGFHDTVDVFTSLQRPKKIMIKGSDGKLYSIICKPKDDLRKDCRFMEFNNLVNRYLISDPEARKSQLYIRTYAVIPLNEECGLIEYVPNLSGMRPIITNIYRNKGVHVSLRTVKQLLPHQYASPEQKLQTYKSKILPRFPSVFSLWFLSTFPDPTSWYHARLAYARTTSVMSMVGYIVGLGDRHGENILFDSSCGDTVHVDLNCLFNKGETMECPECVPFRLTHNMVDAMGPTGYEGIFRKACEVTIRVMRSQTDALMSVLRPFVHDPLVEWSRRNSRAQPLNGEIRNEMGLTHVKDIELRLNGIIKSKNKTESLPLSIEGQVNYLIQEATDERNLSQMYIGWSAFY